MTDPRSRLCLVLLDLLILLLQLCIVELKEERLSTTDLEQSTDEIAELPITLGSSIIEIWKRLSQ